MFTDGRKGGWGRGRKDGCKRMKLVAWYAPILGEDPEVLSLLALLITTHRETFKIRQLKALLHGCRTLEKCLNLSVL